MTFLLTLLLLCLAVMRYCDYIADKKESKSQKRKEIEWLKKNIKGPSNYLL